MAGETVITVVGNLTADPELRYTQNGLAVVNFTIASTPRTFDRQANEWKDGDALFLRASAWRDFAEHVAQTLTKGMRVMAQGRLVQRSYTDKDNNPRVSYELEVDDIGPSLKYATAQVFRQQTNQNQQQNRQQAQHQSQQMQGGYQGGAPAQQPYQGGQQQGQYQQPPQQQPMQQQGGAQPQQQWQQPQGQPQQQPQQQGQYDDETPF